MRITALSRNRSGAVLAIQSSDSEVMLEHSTREIDGCMIHVVTGGPTDAPAFVCLHGWPQSWASWEPVMRPLASMARVVAIDLPGIGGSLTPPPASDKRALAGTVHRLIEDLGLREVTLVGHDVGGMITYAFLRTHASSIARAAIVGVVIPGIEPWSKVISNPMVWHFGFHATAELPELLVGGHEARYFDWFFDAISANPAAISREARDGYAAAYARPDALHTGFEWYRAFAQDARDNEETRGQLVTTPVLYVRGDRDRGELDTYVRELRKAGLREVRGELIAGAGHYVPDEQPEALVEVLRRFAGLAMERAPARPL
jgi:pimeloyl-ACP methyl ester carboxylesterase